MFNEMVMMLMKNFEKFLKIIANKGNILISRRYQLHLASTHQQDIRRHQGYTQPKKRNK
jgi:hypothetical protein